LNDATRSLLRAIVAHLSALPPEGRHSWPWHFVADLLPAPPTPPLVLLAELS
jgi:hypothetical protein